MPTSIDDFYVSPDYRPGQQRKVLLVQVDIEGHSKLSREQRPADVMAMKTELAESLARRLASLDFRGVGWQGDGGMFGLDVTDDPNTVDKVAPAWRAIRHAAEEVSKRFHELLKGSIVALRTSAHVCEVYVHSDPRYWHSEGLNEFAKAERELGVRGRFIITGELHRLLPIEAKREFERRQQDVSVSGRADTYEHTGGTPGDLNMDFNLKEMKAIQREVRSFCSAMRAQRAGSTKPVLQDLLVIVDLQRDFAGDRPLAVERAEEVAAANSELALAARSKGLAVVVTRDWHPVDHYSFRTWPRHCVVDEIGAEFISTFRFSEHSDEYFLSDIGAANDMPDYNPYVDPELAKFMAVRSPERIYVSGIALEYCVLATCLASRAFSDRVIALDDYIRSAKSDEAHFAWDLLREEGVERLKENPFA